MVVLHVAAPARAGGLERVVQYLAIGHRALGHRSHVAAVVDPGESDHSFLEPLRAGGVEVHVIEVPARAYAREWRQAVALYRQVRPDVVHCHGQRPDIVEGNAARRLGIPVVSTHHGYWHGGELKHRIVERLQLSAFRRFDAVVACAHSMAKEMLAKGVRADRLHTIVNAFFPLSRPVDRATARHELGIADDAVVVGWAARMTPQKGLDVLIDALAALQDLPFDVQVFGDGPMRHAMQERARARGVDRRIRWRGVHPEAARILPAFDVFVLSSRGEGTPIALFEAMAAGVPIVSSDVGDVSAMLGPGEARLVAAEDPEALAGGIRAVLADPVAAAAAAAAARSRLERDFRPEPWLARYEALYSQVVKRAVRRV